MNAPSTQSKLDLKVLHAPLFRASAVEFVELTVPRLRYLQIDGQGDPGDEVFKAAVEWLYGVSYAMKFASKKLGRDYVVPPLQGLWWADDPESFVRREKHLWRWTLMLMVPEFVGKDIYRAAVEGTASKRGAPPPAGLRLEDYDEGLSLQILHVGSFEAEGPVLRKLHKEVMPQRGYAFNGPHHEIYLSDARRTAPEKLRTILRQPVKPA